MPANCTGAGAGKYPAGLPGNAIRVMNERLAIDRRAGDVAEFAWHEHLGAKKHPGLDRVFS